MSARGQAPQANLNSQPTWDSSFTPSPSWLMVFEPIWVPGKWLGPVT